MQVVYIPHIQCLNNATYVGKRTANKKKKEKKATKTAPRPASRASAPPARSQSPAPPVSQKSAPTTKTPGRQHRRKSRAPPSYTLPTLSSAGASRPPASRHNAPAPLVPRSTTPTPPLRAAPPGPPVPRSSARRTSGARSSASRPSALQSHAPGRSVLLSSASRASAPPARSQSPGPPVSRKSAPTTKTPGPRPRRRSSRTPPSYNLPTLSSAGASRRLVPQSTTPAPPLRAASQGPPVPRSSARRTSGARSSSSRPPALQSYAPEHSVLLSSTAGTLVPRSSTLGSASRSSVAKYPAQTRSSRSPAPTTSSHAPAASSLTPAASSLTPAASSLTPAASSLTPAVPPPTRAAPVPAKTIQSPTGIAPSPTTAAPAPAPEEPPRRRRRRFYFHGGKYDGRYIKKYIEDEEDNYDHTPYMERMIRDRLVPLSGIELGQIGFDVLESSRRIHIKRAPDLPEEFIPFTKDYEFFEIANDLHEVLWYAIDTTDYNVCTKFIPCCRPEKYTIKMYDHLGYGGIFLEGFIGKRKTDIKMFNKKGEVFGYVTQDLREKGVLLTGVNPDDDVCFKIREVPGTKKKRDREYELRSPDEKTLYGIAKQRWIPTEDEYPEWYAIGYTFGVNYPLDLHINTKTVVLAALILMFFGIYKCKMYTDRNPPKDPTDYGRTLSTSETQILYSNKV